MSKVNATCTWGDGPDVLVSLFDKKFMLYPSTNVFVHGAFCLTATEAKALGNELIEAGKMASNLEKFAEHSSCPHCEQDWEKHGPCPCVE